METQLVERETDIGMKTQAPGCPALATDLFIGLRMEPRDILPCGSRGAPGRLSRCH
jgi:hypothetical protein